MAAEKTTAVSFRDSLRFKALFELAAARENSSLTSMLGNLRFTHCELDGLQGQTSSAGDAKGAKT